MRVGSALLSRMGILGLGAASTLVAFAVWSTACSGTSNSGSVGPSPDQACADSAHAVCSKMQTCAPANIQSAYGGESTCETRIKASCLNALAAPSTGASPSQTESCAQAYPSYACADYLNKMNIPAACQQVTGSIAAGGACEFAGQCQTGFCAIAPGGACGKCATAPMQGDSCAQLTSCGPTLTCARDMLVCTTVAAQGQACGAGEPCGTGLSCIAPGGVGTAGTCQTAGVQVGAACDGSLKTGPSCDNALGLYCDGKTKQCAQTAYATGETACGYSVDAGTLVECTAGSCENGACAARATDNGACVVSDGGAATPSAGCLPPARCVATSGTSGTCQVVTASNCQ
jgi:hypothetical protein